jgi:hypothetical protein
MARLIAINTYPNSVRPKLSGSLRLLWYLMRISVLCALLLLAPVVELVCGGLLLLGLLVSIALRLSGAGTDFPLWHVLALSLGFGAFLILYHAVIGLLSC